MLCLVPEPNTKIRKYFFYSNILFWFHHIILIYLVRDNLSSSSSSQPTHILPTAGRKSPLRTPLNFFAGCAGFLTMFSFAIKFWVNLKFAHEFRKTQWYLQSGVWIWTHCPLLGQADTPQKTYFLYECFLGKELVMLDEDLSLIPGLFWLPFS